MVFVNPHAAEMLTRISAEVREMLAAEPPLYTTPQPQPDVQDGYVLVPAKPTRAIEDAIGRSRNLKASEIWEEAIAAHRKAQ